MPSDEPTLISDDVLSVAPALRAYMQDNVIDGLWRRPQLSPRDRSIVTLAVLITRNQTLDIPFYLRLALDSGLKPVEISEIVTHLAFYAGLGNAASTIAIVKDVFGERGIAPNDLPPVDPKLLPLDAAAEATRAANVEENAGTISPGLVQFTADVLFLKLWLRPDLAPRDRSLVTVSSLMAAGHIAQITFHLNKAMDNGLTKEQAGEVIAQVAFYAGWPDAFSAAPVVGEVFKSRGQQSA
ncbi:carboxymuconolactone decarboxylase family protein [Methylovirgula sp. 4M-Z18]|uniref:carboxymuconolactone decarboxylase family protein n=1 Tax=Methylovirgula sp. 4M-Z18 TaxID=2293567 RepID=UPI001FE00B6F|nr:carboxymuconolactone decarboxylase family protein [Methylovirgula sp. 4M-Z18]